MAKTKDIDFVWISYSGLPIKFNTDKTKHPIEIEVYGDKIKNIIVWFAKL